MSESWVIGAAADCDLVLDSPGVSGRHCRLSRDDGRYVLEDLKSTNGTFVHGERIARPIRVARGDAITLGRQAPMPWPPEGPSEPKTLRVGRAPDNDIVIDVPMVSSWHAFIRPDPAANGAWIEDRGSANGTAIGAPGRVAGPIRFTSADTVYFGSHAVAGSWLLQRCGVVSAALTFRGGAMTLGRDVGCDARIDEPQVSTRHARLVRDGGKVWIEDLGSANGTSVNGRPVRGPTPVVDGDTIGLGSYTVTLALAPEPASAGQGVSSSSPLIGLWPIAAVLAQGALVGLVILLAAKGAGGDGARAALVSSVLGVAAVWMGLSAVLLDRFADSGGRGDAAARSMKRVRKPLVGMAAILASALAWFIVALGAGLKAGAEAPMWLLTLTTLVGWALGDLLLVALRRLDAAALAAAVAMAAVVLFGGTWTPSRAVSALVPSRWAYEGLLLAESSRARAADPDLAEPYFSIAKDRTGINACIYALGFMLVGLGGAEAIIAWGPESSSRRGTPSPAPGAR